MRKFILAAASMAALTACAHAADFGPYDEQAVFTPNLYDWNGFYLGGNAGYLWGNSRVFSVPGGVPSGSFSKNGFIGGIQGGFNYQTGSWVWGAEADIQYSGANGSTTVGCAPGCSAELDWFGTLRGRAGYAYDRALVYLTGGLAYGSTTTAAVGAGSFGNTKSGWTLGGGVEYGFAPHWTAKAEYLYMDLGSTSNAALGYGGDYSSNHILRVGVNRIFN